MISSKKLIKIARKWQRLTAASRKRVSWPGSKVVDKGHFVIYTTDGIRFMIPLTYLKSEIVTQLFRMAEEEFGLMSDGPLTVPCDSTFIEYAISMLQRHAAKDFERALILSLSTCHSSSSCLQQEQINQHLPIHSF